MSDEDELIAEAQQSREKTQQLREESGLDGDDGERATTDDVPQDPLPPEKNDPQPWAKFSTGRDPDD